MCVCKGVPAKYKDPATGRYYCDVQAYKALRALVSTREEVELDQRIVELAVALDNKAFKYNRLVQELALQHQQLQQQQQQARHQSQRQQTLRGV